MGCGWAQHLWSFRQPWIGARGTCYSPLFPALSFWCYIHADLSMVLGGRLSYFSLLLFPELPKLVFLLGMSCVAGGGVGVWGSGAGCSEEEREVSLQVSRVKVGKWMYLVEFYPWLMCYHPYILWWCICMREIQACRSLGDNLGPKQKTSSSPLPVKHLDLIYPWISLIKSTSLANWFSQMSFSELAILE